MTVIYDYDKKKAKLIKWIMSKLYGELSKICLRTTLLVYLLTKRSVVLLCRQSKMCSANHCSGEFNEEPKYSIGIHWFCCTNASVPNTVFEAVRQTLQITVSEKVYGHISTRLYLLVVRKKPRLRCLLESIFLLCFSRLVFSLSVGKTSYGGIELLSLLAYTLPLHKTSKTGSERGYLFSQNFQEKPC